MSINDLIQARDTGKMLEKLLSFSDQCRDAESISPGIGGIQLPERIVFCGMGGSAIGGDILKTICDSVSTVPVFVNRDYSLPSWAGRETLVISASYSGNTEETVSSLKNAKKKGCGIVCISSNGIVEKLSSEYSAPFIKIPGGYPPRCAFGYLFFPVYGLLASIGAVKAMPRTIFGKMDRWIEDFSPGSEDSEPLAIARRLEGRVPLLYSNPAMYPALMRWKTQIAENSKTFSFVNSIPEMNHNEIMSWRHPEWFVNRCLPVFVETSREEARIKLRMDITREIISGIQPDILTVRSKGSDLLSDLLYLVILGDWISFYLAVLNGSDPTEISEINTLKKQLGGLR